jgi:RES domain-containing protein
MSLSAHLEQWRGDAYRHIPAGSQLDVLDFRHAGRSAENRWNEPGHPTLYLAGDEGVLIAEWGRHFAVNRAPALQNLAVARAVYRLTLEVDRLLDLRKPEVWALLSLAGAPTCFTSTGVARATAHFIRGTTAAQALLVPSIGFLDQLDRWCLVLFLEKLPDPASFIASVTHCGHLRRAG